MLENNKGKKTCLDWLLTTVGGSEINRALWWIPLCGIVHMVHRLQDATLGEAIGSTVGIPAAFELFIKLTGGMHGNQNWGCQRKGLEFLFVGMAAVAQVYAHLYIDEWMHNGEGWHPEKEFHHAFLAGAMGSVANSAAHAMLRYSNIGLFAVQAKRQGEYAAGNVQYWDACIV